MAIKEETRRSRKSRKPRRLLIGGIVFITLVLAILPVILSMDWARQRLATELSAQLGTQVSVESHSLGWFSGLQMQGLEIANPPGFPQDQPLCRVKELQADCNISILFSQLLRVDSEVQGLELRVHQLADGSSNLEALGAKQEEEQEPEPAVEDEPAPEAEDKEQGLKFQTLDLDLKDSWIQFSHADLGVLETMEHLNLDLHMFRKMITCNLSSASPNLQLELSHSELSDYPDTGLDQIEFATQDLQLANYQPLLTWLMGEDFPLQEMQGLVSGKLNGAYTHSNGVSILSGDLQIEKPLLAGKLDQEFRLQAERWELRPHIILQQESEGTSKVFLDNFFMDLGFLQLQGLDRKEKDAVGLQVNVDLGQLAATNLPGTQELRGRKGQLEGEVSLPLDWPGWQSENMAKLLPEEILRQCLAKAKVSLDSYEIAGLQLQNFKGDLSMRDGQLSLQTTEGGTLNGGPFNLQVQAQPFAGEDLPTQVKLSWHDGQLKGDAVEILRYVVPLFAGLDLRQPLDLQGIFDGELELRGPALKADAASWLQWGNLWEGDGEIKLRDGSFSPSQQWQGLLELAGQRGRINFNDIHSKFKIQQGSVETSLMKFNSKAASYGLRGKVTLAGALDYKASIPELLKGHRDGEHLLRYLGENSREAGISGTLDQPKLSIPKLSDLLQDAAQGALQKGIEKEVEGALEKALDKLLKRKKKEN